MMMIEPMEDAHNARTSRLYKDFWHQACAELGLERNRIMKAIHYPECWDTAAYPTWECALSETYAGFRCACDVCPQMQSSDEQIDAMLLALMTVTGREALTIAGRVTWDDATRARLRDIVHIHMRHTESGKTADELWVETGRLRALIADQDAVVVALTAQLDESSDLVARLRRQVDAVIEEKELDAESLTHALCTEHGVPQGRLAWRLEVLRGLLANSPAAQTEDEVLEEIRMCIPLHAWTQMDYHHLRAIRAAASKGAK